MLGSPRQLAILFGKYTTFCLGILPRHAKIGSQSATRIRKPHEINPRYEQTTKPMTLGVVMILRRNKTWLLFFCCGRGQHVLPLRQHVRIQHAPKLVHSDYIQMPLGLIDLNTQPASDATISPGQRVINYGRLT